jgi:hypothetical protein
VADQQRWQAGEGAGEKNHHMVSIPHGLVRRTNEPAKELANLKRTPPCE